MKSKTGFGYLSCAFPVLQNIGVTFHCAHQSALCSLPGQGAFRSKLLPTIPCNTKKILHWQVKEHKKAKKGKCRTVNIKNKMEGQEIQRGNRLSNIILQIGHTSTLKQK